jgi:hypothetical protein
VPISNHPRRLLTLIAKLSQRLLITVLGVYSSNTTIFWNFASITNGQGHTWILLWYAYQSSYSDPSRLAASTDGAPDPEKGKYFKIQPNHAVPSAAKHSKQAVDAQSASAKVR